ncbi:hypothetical protein [endosymbiont GvMRE of Glomus versiforme]|uniref:hypothetical protein n=1 Tax=endosymbiont GvMRE of Glomus versiforme TaxID=2039283 RepID=UPI000EEC55FD|nr:hypothetical protein [endosymbiont GvMRE of Glomus versiforme]RHZ37284.1 hypothetical protein GvMRE_I1g587 [endosymbiont GvMRE of Glomus versiforme]
MYHGYQGKLITNNQSYDGYKSYTLLTEGGELSFTSRDNLPPGFCRIIFRGRKVVGFQSLEKEIARYSRHLKKPAKNVYYYYHRGNVKSVNPYISSDKNSVLGWLVLFGLGLLCLGAIIKDLFNL